MLPDQNRLRRREDFTKVYASGKQYQTSHIKLRIYNTGNLELQTQIGIVVSKKVSKKAIVRNQIKRRIRAIFRIFLPQLKQGLQIVVTIFVNPSGIPSYTELWEDLNKLFDKAKVRHGN